MSTERVIWEGKPSQVYYLGTYILCILFCFLIVPIFIALWRMLLIKRWRFRITDQKVYEERGVFSRIFDVMDLFRIKDIRLEQPFFLGMFGLWNIVLVTTDKTDPIMVIPAVPNGRELMDELSTAIADARREHGVRIVEYE